MRSPRRSGSGRPHKGPRLLFSVRLPEALGEAVRAEAEQLDMTYSDYVAGIVAEKFGYPAPGRKDAAQMELTA